ncbi:MAG: oligoendopeptidase F [Atopobiaceae bacterium]
MSEELPVYQSRDQIPQKYRWDIQSLYPSDDAFMKALDDARQLPKRYEEWRPKALASGKGLLEFLRFDDEVEQTAERLYNYAGRRADEDTRVSKYQDRLGQVTVLVSQLNAASAWFEPALLALGDDTLEQWYRETAGLDLYRRAIDRMRAQRKHVLPPDQEALLAQAGEMAAQPGQVFTMLNDADIRFADAVDSKGEAHPLTHGTYVPLISSQDRALRESTYHNVYQAYRNVRNTAAGLLAAQMRQLKFFSQARGYQSSLEASLAPTEVPVEVYDNLIASVHRGKGAMQRYLELRRRQLGVDQLRYWDLYVPFVKTVQHHYTYEQACDLATKALAPLGSDYVDVVRKGFQDRWVDVYETPGKASGAYSSDGHVAKPLILLNFQGDLDSVYTLAHEMGHSMQTWLSTHKQPSRYANYEMFVAEVASTTNECLLTHYLLDHASDDAERAFLLNHFCEQFRTTLYRQTLFAEFERDANAACKKGEGMGADALSERYCRLNDDYYGPVAVSDDDIALEWARIPHFYYNFYVYVYATSFAAAVSLSERMLREGQPAVDDYLGFLSAGCSKPPIELLRDAGVDMASGKAVDDALGKFAQLVEQLEQTL